MLSKYFKSQKDQTDFFIALAVIAFAGLFIGYYSFTSDEPIIALPSNTMEISNPKVDSLELDGKTFVAVESDNFHSKRKPFNRNFDEFKGVNVSNATSDTIQAVSKRTDLESLKSKDMEDEESIDEDEFVEDEFDEEIEDITDDFDDEITDADAELESDAANDLTVDSTEIDLGTSGDNVVDEKEALEDASLKDEKRNDVTPGSNTSKDCIIVIGAFGDARNIKKLIGQLDFKGYPIFKVPYKGLTRVGVYEDCEKVESVLLEIRKKYSPDAFIMKASK